MNPQSTDFESNQGKEPDHYLFVGRSYLRDRLHRFAETLSNTYMFFGPPGSGKLELALHLATMVLCPYGGCGRCGTCISISRGEHLDLTILRRSGNFIEIDDVRSVLRDAVQTPNYGGNRLVIIPEIHLAQRSGPTLLKTIEEPPSKTIFIFTAEAIEGEILPIASRCIQIEVPRLSDAAIKSYLMTLGTLDDQTETIVEASIGRLDFAKSLSQNPAMVDYLNQWLAVVESTPHTPTALSELASILTEAPPLSSESETKSQGRKKRDELDLVLMGINYLARQLSKANLRTTFDRQEALDALSRAARSLQLNVSVALAVREAVFSIALL